MLRARGLPQGPETLIAAGVAPAAISIAHTYIDAAKIIADEATDDDFVVVFGTDKAALVEQYRAAFREARSPA